MQKTYRRYLSYLKYFCPGAIIDCMTIGAGSIAPIAQQLNDCRLILSLPPQELA
jgi:hypothetical protein